MKPPPLPLLLLLPVKVKELKLVKVVKKVVKEQAVKLVARDLDPKVARTVADIGRYFGPTLTVMIVLVVVPVGVAAWRGE